MIKAIRGMRDILPPETSRWQWVESVAREVFDLYGYQEIRLPLLERTELFARSIGEETDIVAKEMYTFPDRKGDSLTLRPEATASVLRAVLENRLEKGAGVKKFYTLGPMFRYERPQKGRFRQFYQINCEAYGVETPELDVEVILLLMHLLKRLLPGELRLLVNSLGCPGCQVKFKAALGLFLINREGLCDDCQRRRTTNPLRVLDCKSANCQGILHNAPVIRDYLCPDCAAHFARVLELLDRFNVAYELKPKLVRGLDYYTRTAFEVAAVGLGAQDAVAGGGRYNGLAKAVGRAGSPRHRLRHRRGPPPGGAAPGFRPGRAAPGLCGGPGRAGPGAGLHRGPGLAPARTWPPRWISRAGPSRPRCPWRTAWAPLTPLSWGRKN